MYKTAIAKMFRNKLASKMNLTEPIPIQQNNKSNSCNVNDDTILITSNPSTETIADETTRTLTSSSVTSTPQYLEHANATPCKLANSFVVSDTSTTAMLVPLASVIDIQSATNPIIIVGPNGI